MNYTTSVSYKIISASSFCENDIHEIFIFLALFIRNTIFDIENNYI